MLRKETYLSILILFAVFNVFAQNYSNPIVDEDLILEEKNGMLSVEAEYFFKQSKNEVRQWYRFSKNEEPNVGRDEDQSHCFGASNNAYLEILPDTRVTHGDKLVNEENFSNDAGKLAIPHYKVKINTPGRFSVWVRAFSTGSEDNGLHVGFNGEWPEHGRRMQWCQGKNQWTWASQQRTQEVHCGVPKEIYLDIMEPGIHEIQFSMREDGFEFDKFILTTDIDYFPEGIDQSINVYSGTLPEAYPAVEAAVSNNNNIENLSYIDQLLKTDSGNKAIKAVQFPIENTNFYKDRNWLAINPNQHKEAKATMLFPFEDGMYDLIFVGVGENDGQSTFQLLINDKEAGKYSVPLSKSSFEEAVQYNDLWENISLKKGDKLTVIAAIGSKDGQEYSRGRWAGIILAPMTKGKDVLEKAKTLSTAQNVGSAPVINGEVQLDPKIKKNKSVQNRNGNGVVAIEGELKQWHKVSLTLDGPFASETDTRPNPFTDYRMTVTFTHESGTPSYAVPAYFAADGEAGESGASEGTKWRAHLSPDKTGKWNYKISFLKGAMVATADMPWMKVMNPYDGIEGNFEISESDKTGRDFRSKGRLEYVGKHHLQFKGTKEFFYKAGTDAPETLLGYEDFDNTVAMKTNVPLKKYLSHVNDYVEGDPTWHNGKGKGLIGAVNYLAGKGINSISFLTYNAGGDGDNVWPFVNRNDKFNYDCSKLDQWQLVFDHAQSKGLYLHFKTQETENDDNIKGHNKEELIPEALDGGDLGPERRLYYRELIARYGYLLALNWNLGEENTQSFENHIAMADFFAKTDPYHHNVVLHTYPNQQDKIYEPLLGDQSELTGLSLQNSWDAVFKQTLKWVNASSEKGKPWVVANDEQNSAGKGVPPDPAYKGFDASTVGYSIDDIRKQTLWGNIMAGGAGVEYYFGYQLPENDLICEDFRSRDKSWDYCRVAINFLHKANIPFQEMKNCNALIGNNDLSKDKFCLAKENEIYMVYLAYVSTSTLDLTSATGKYSVEWYNPKIEGGMQKGSIKTVKGGKIVELGKAPSKADQDWIVVIRKQ